MEEITLQLDNEMTVADIKMILRGIKMTLVNQLGKDNSRMWRKWEEEASHQTTYEPNNYNIWEDWYNERGDYEKKATSTPAKTTHTTQYTNRPKRFLKEWSLVLTEEVTIFINQLMATNTSMEWGVAFTWLMDKEKKQVIIDRIYLMPVVTTSGHVTFVNESEFLLFSKMTELGEFVKDIDNKTRFAGIMHSHHTMGSWHSSTDHGTIATYIRDFGTVLSIVWAQKSKGEIITADIILENTENSYAIKKIEPMIDDKMTFDEIMDVDCSLTTRYNDLHVIVNREYDRYKTFLNKFESSGKYLKIHEFYNAVYDDDNSCNNMDLIKELVL